MEAQIDVLASERHFVDHLAPVWLALPEQLRGDFVVPGHLGEHAAARGIEGGELTREDRRTLVASYADVKRARRKGRSRLAAMEHGIGQAYGNRNESYAGGADRDDVELFLVPNSYSAELWQAAYPDARVDIVGTPRLDRLPAREAGPGPVVAISFHWMCRIVPETMPAWSTFKDALPTLAERFTVLGHGHPRMMELLSGHYRRMGIEVVADFDEVCRRADLYVCDNSSTLYEFAAMGRPVVVMNAPTYRRDVEHGLRFWSAAGVGMQVDRPEDLVTTVEAALGDPAPAKAAREAALALVYAFRFGAAQRAAQAVTEWLS